MRSLLVTALGSCAALFASACSPYNPDLGDNPFLCGMEDPVCPTGYTCEENGELPPKMICVIEGGAIVDAPDNSGFDCADDSQIEGSQRNDTIMTAYQTPVAMQRKDIPYVGLAICPEGDKDLYAIHTQTQGQNIEIVVTWDSGASLSAAILQGSGVSINNATSNGERSIRAYAPGLPVGTYYAQVFAGSMAQNNYNLNIVVTP